MYIEESGMAKIYFIALVTFIVLIDTASAYLI